MTADLLQQLEQKVTHAVEVIELLRLQVEELEVENMALKAEHEKWRSDLSALIKRLDQIDVVAQTARRVQSQASVMASMEEEFMTV